MTVLGKFLTASAVASILAGPAAAQYPYPQPYPQPYPPTYPNPYPYQQPYGGNVIDNVINQLLGNRYSVSDRTAVRQCASAAMSEASRQYRYQPYGYGYNQPYGGYNQPYGGYAGNMRVTAITEVERRSNGLRVRGELDSGRYGNIYPNQGIVRPGDLTFRCTVDYRGYVSDVRVRPNDRYRRY